MKMGRSRFSFSCILLAGRITVVAEEPVFRIDLATDLRITRILSGAPIFRQTTWGTPRETYYLAEGMEVKERQYVLEIRLPKEGVLKLRSNLTTLMAKNGMVTRLTLNSGIMPLEEAHQAAVEISTMMNLQTDRITEWHKKAILLQGPETCLLMTRTYPEVAFEVRSSINTVYPYMLTAEISWTDDRGGAKLPPPFPEPITISMDPPSGKIYDPAEMWGDPKENARQLQEWMKRNPGEADRVRKELEEQKRKYPPQPSSAAKVPPAPMKLPAAEPSHFWKWLAAALLALAASGALIRKRMRNKRLS